MHAPYGTDGSVDLVWMQLIVLLFFLKQKTAYEISTRDWSSDVCSSDLARRSGARLRVDPARNCAGHRETVPPHAQSNVSNPHGRGVSRALRPLAILGGA